MLVAYTSPAFAQLGGDALIEGAKLCTRHLPRYEREYGVPTHLLSAIASTESGRYHNGLKISVPWPWTINAEGKGYYFDSKEEAVAAARKLQQRGVTSMDVGCMQVNLYHHSRAFASLEKAFDPETNIAYAASFLRALYQESASWKKAASDYHSKTPQRGTQYVGIVYDKWYKIVDKLRDAKLQLPDESVQRTMAGDEPVVVPDAQVTRIAALSQPVEVAPVVTRIAALPEQEGKKLPQHKAPRMNSITISRGDSGVIHVKPQIKLVEDVADAAASAVGTQLVQIAQARTASVPITAPSTAQVLPAATAGDASVMHIGARANTVTTTKRSGPNFIFND